MVTLDPALTAILPSWGTDWIEGGTGIGESKRGEEIRDRNLREREDEEERRGDTVA